MNHNHVMRKESAHRTVTTLIIVAAIVSSLIFAAVYSREHIVLQTFHCGQGRTLRVLKQNRWPFEETEVLYYQAVDSGTASTPRRIGMFDKKVSRDLRVVASADSRAFGLVHHFQLLVIADFAKRNFWSVGEKMTAELQEVDELLYNAP